MPDKISEILLKANAVVLRTNPPFRWISGILSPIYTDSRLLMSYPKEREIIVNSFARGLFFSSMTIFSFGFILALSTNALGSIIPIELPHFLVLVSISIYN